MQARFLRVGDIVYIEETNSYEVIRDVRVTISLSNGNTPSVPPQTEYSIQEPEIVPGRPNEVSSPLSELPNRENT